MMLKPPCNIFSRRQNKSKFLKFYNEMNVIFEKVDFDEIYKTFRPYLRPENAAYWAQQQTPDMLVGGIGSCVYLLCHSPAIRHEQRLTNVL